MKCHRQHRRVMRYAICTVAAATLVTGCASSGNLAVSSAGNAADSQSDGKLARAIKKAERQVEKAPQDASARADLASLYLQAGRFESAVTTFEDAQKLGDKSVRTALSLALAYTGAGHNSDAVAVLDQWRDSIPASDLGLALALAGETDRGVTILSDALRGGEDTPKLRQNLAYAYALDGRWREARLMAAQDVPADQLDARISEWAHQGRPGDYRERVAGMLGVPVRTDAGQPEYLALSQPSAEAPAALADAGTDEELPPVEKGESFWVAEAARPETPVVARQEGRPEAVSAPPAPAPTAVAQNDFEQAFAPATPGIQFVSQPVVQSLPLRKSRDVASSRALVPTVMSTGDSTHLVQLGSFSSEKNAERAWNVFVSRNPELANFDRTITQAYVRGKTYWRVSASGFDKRGARSMCSTVKTRGGGCIAYSGAHPLPGAVSEASSGGAERARR